MKEKRAMTVQVKPIFLALEQVAAAVSLSESTVQKLVREESFPKPRLLFDQRTAWLAREVEEWAEARPVSDLLPPPNSNRSRASSRVVIAKDRSGRLRLTEEPSLALQSGRRVGEGLARDAEPGAAGAELSDELMRTYGLPLKPFIRRHELRQMVPLSDSTIYRLEEQGDFPKRFNLTPCCVVWYLDEVTQWLEARRTGAVQIQKTPPPDITRRKYRPVKAELAA